MTFGSTTRAQYGLPRVPVEVLLVVGLRLVERRGAGDLGDDGIAPELLRRELLDHRLRRLPLRVALAENDRPILGSHVVALAIRRGRVVDREEHGEEIAEREHGGIEGHPHDFRVSGAPGAHFVVGRALVRAARVARLDRDHAVEAVEDGFEAPEAAAAEDCDLGGGYGRRIVHGIPVDSRASRALHSVVAGRRAYSECAGAVERARRWGPGPGLQDGAMR